MPARTGGHTHCRCLRINKRGYFCALVGLVLYTATATAEQSIGPVPRAVGPVARSHAPGADIRQSWYALPPQWISRGSPVTYDNGPPLDDGFSPASQISSPAGAWPEFYGASADDFIVTGGSPTNDFHITTVRTAFHFANEETGTETPTTTFEGVYVTIYFNVTPSLVPSGAPTVSGGQTGPYLVSRFVPASSLQNQILVGTCLPFYQVDIPVDIAVSFNQTYWLSIVPVFQGPPQSFWPFSEVQNQGRPGMQGFHVTGDSPNPPFWTTVAGNDGTCSGAPAPGSATDLAFMLLGEETPIVTGACCNDATAGCSAPVNKSVCQQSDQRFSEGISCGGVTPPCGTTNTGACCLGDGVCQELNPTNCQNSGGVWQAGNCNLSPCTPSNGLCANAISISSGVFVFSTIGALADGPPDTPTAPCTNIGQDIWFKYTSGCTGTVTVSLCGANNFDSALAAYQTWNCFPNLGLRVACHNDFCGDDAQISFPATANQQFLIRVGGAGAASGTGTMTITCVAAGAGACCKPDNTCEVLTQAQCQSLMGTYTGGQPCSLLTCPAPVNDLCANAILVSSNTILPFATGGATTDGPADTPTPPCTVVNQDVWYQYTADCTGQLTASLCNVTNFNAAMAIYDGCSCPPTLGTVLGCDNDSCAVGGAAQVTVPVVMGQCYLIRVGGDGPAFGLGELSLNCIPDSGNVNVCAGDANNDCAVDLNDISGFVDELLGNIVLAPSGVCRVDLSNDGQLDGRDIQPFVEKMIGTNSCACCRGDMNNDGLLDGRDLQGMIDAVLSPPQPCTANYRAADVNMDDIVDVLDADALVTRLLSDQICANP